MAATEIAYQNKDIFSKWMGEGLKGKSFAAYGLDLPKIVSVEPTNLPVVEAHELRIDNLFFLADGTCAVVDYESTYEEEDKVKYAGYLLGVAKRFLREKRELPLFRMLVVYTADVARNEVHENLELRAFTLRLQPIFLSELDGDAIYKEIAGKLGCGERLTDTECMQLMIFPLTYRGKEHKQEAIAKAIDLADKIEDKRQLTMILPGILVFCDKVIDKESSQRIKERIRMTQVGRLFEEEKQEAVREKEQEERMSTIRKLMTKLGYTAEQAMDFLDLPKAERKIYLTML